MDNHAPLPGSAPLPSGGGAPAASASVDPTPLSDGTSSASASSPAPRILLTTELSESAVPQASPAAAIPESASSRHAADPRPPSQLGEFRLLRKLGEGAMGAVYKAHQLTTGRDVAVKILFPHLARNPRLLERFYREARILGQMDHPNIVCGYAVGEENGWHYFAMEYVDGRSVQKWLSLLGRFSVGDAVHVVLACADALSYAHAQGLVHRDIKPDNILITRQGIVKLTDLGTVKMMDEDLSLTQTGNGIGTPCYMPLEQARNAKESDGRSDIYALGCVLYCLLTGRPPFTGATIVELIQAKDVGRFTPARKTNPAVPERLDLIIDKMVAKVLRYRYQTCAEVIRDLRALGLMNPTLSFIPTGSQCTPTPLPAGDPTPPPTLTLDPALIAPRSSDPPSRATGDCWYIRIRRPDGPVTRQLTTGQVEALIRSKKLGISTVASRSPNGSFRSLGSYKEFEPLLFPQASRVAADQQTSKFRSIYQKIEEDDRDRTREKVEDPHLPAWPVVLYRIALIAVGSALALALLRLLLQWFARSFANVEL